MVTLLIFTSSEDILEKCPFLVCPACNGRLSALSAVLSGLVQSLYGPVMADEVASAIPGMLLWAFNDWFRHLVTDRPLMPKTAVVRASLLKKRIAISQEQVTSRAGMPSKKKAVSCRGPPSWYCVLADTCVCQTMDCVCATCQAYSIQRAVRR